MAGPPWRNEDCSEFVEIALSEKESTSLNLSRDDHDDEKLVRT
jgi:hypothetical protein